jgi:nucleoid-associated protein YgaU
MSLFRFGRDSGKKPSKSIADQVRDDLQAGLGGRVSNLQVAESGGTVTLSGRAQSQADREKAILLAGNVAGVETVRIENFELNEPHPATQRAPEPRFYTVQKGDSLSKIAQQHYGDANKWRQLHEANREVVGSDPDKIYPGQQIRIPEDA